jgi:TPR repeat protein
MLSETSGASFGTGVTLSEEAIYRKAMAGEGGADFQNYCALLYYQDYYQGPGSTNDCNLFPKKLQRAVALWTRAAEKGDVAAQCNLARVYGSKEFEWNFKKAAEWYEQAAEQGNAEAQTQLVTWYCKNRGVPKERAKAADWHTKAAEQGNAEAQTSLAHMYATGKGAAKDAKKAAGLYAKAAAQGEPLGQYHLGDMYSRGYGVAKDKKKMLEWFEKAGEQGEIRSQNRLILFCWGEMDEDSAVPNMLCAESKHLIPLFFTEKAARWLTKVAERGESSFAERELGCMYHDGIGVLKDTKKAAKWMTAAAKEKMRDWGGGEQKVEAGDKKAQQILSWMYENGVGVQQDLKHAVKWMTKAAEQGGVVAQTNLARLLLNKDKKEAVQWLTKAAESKPSAWAEKYLSKAEKQAIGEAATSLASMYKMGDCVAKDLAKATEYLTIAAERDNANAVVELAGVKAMAVGEALLAEEDEEKAKGVSKACKKAKQRRDRNKKRSTEQQLMCKPKEEGGVEQQVMRKPKGEGGEKVLEPREETPPTAGDRQPEKKSAAARVCGASCCDTLGASLRCAQCRLVWYCSRQCQKVDWRMHKQTCKCEAAIRAAREEQTVLASVKCPQGHQLVRCNSLSNAYCDGPCHASSAISHVPSGSILYGCRECNFDLCPNCSIAAAQATVKILSEREVADSAVCAAGTTDSADEEEGTVSIVVGEQQHGTDVPHLCPIALERMQEDLVNALDGHTYERSAMADHDKERWLEHEDESTEGKDQDQAEREEQEGGEEEENLAQTTAEESAFALETKEEADSITARVLDEWLQQVMDATADNGDSEMLDAAIEQVKQEAGKHDFSARRLTLLKPAKRMLKRLMQKALQVVAPPPAPPALTPASAPASAPTYAPASTAMPKAVPSCPNAVAVGSLTSDDRHGVLVEDQQAYEQGGQQMLQTMRGQTYKEALRIQEQLLQEYSQEFSEEHHHQQKRSHAEGGSDQCRSGSSDGSDCGGGCGADADGSKSPVGDTAPAPTTPAVVGVAIPDEYLCPIMLEVMCDPVFTEDGHTYERSAIEDWFKRGNHRSPKNNEEIGCNLVPNIGLKNLISDFVVRQEQFVGGKQNASTALHSALSSPKVAVAAAPPTTVLGVLEQLKLVQYYEQLTTEGYDEIEDLQNAPTEELIECGVKRPHARRITKCFSE